VNCHSYERDLFLTTLSTIILLLYKNHPDTPIACIVQRLNAILYITEYVIMTQQVYNRKSKKVYGQKKKRGSTRLFKHFIKKTNKKASK